jgi:hypothetical protein
MTNEDLKALALAAIDQEQRWKEAGEPWPIWNTRLLEMQAAANPAAVLGLIADNESLAKNYKSLCDSVAHLNDAATSASDEVARLEAECEGLRKDAERYRFVVDCPIRTMVALGRKAHETDFDLSAECDRLMGQGGQSNG